MNIHSYGITGLTCEHCVAAVTTELTALQGVTGVDVVLVAGGTSTLSVASDVPLHRADLAEALDEAGGYELADD